MASVLLCASGCHSAFVQTTITNEGLRIQNLEVDYPSQSFGTEQLDTNQAFHYRFKVQGSGPVKLEFTDSAKKSHTATGPVLTEQSEGTLAVVIGPDESVMWKPDIQTTK